MGWTLSDPGLRLTYSRGCGDRARPAGHPKPGRYGVKMGQQEARQGSDISTEAAADEFMRVHKHIREHSRRLRAMEEESLRFEYSLLGKLFNAAKSLFAKRGQRSRIL